MSAIENEKQFLECEAARTRLEIQATLEQLKSTVATAGNPAVWARQYPWTSVAIAAAAGVLAGSQLRASDFKDIPEEWRGKWRRGRRELARQRRALRGLYSEILGDTNGAHGENSAKSRWSAPITAVIGKLLKVAIESLVMSLVSATKVGPVDGNSPVDEEEVGHA